MPSLRRTTSSPAVRSSPYPSSLSSSSHNLNTMGGNRPKRTVSDSMTRRVLADIEWWRVFDGQQQEDLFAEQPSDASEDNTGVVGDVLQNQLDTDSLRPSTPVNSPDEDGQVSIVLLTRRYRFVN